ncbi:hypothetical protein BN874_130064 [Candidatus Contendobacter odensis Run_B_J11]|uniref:Uncharacterized protein n=1 Tax=Candidatus Contendobacter odensis Run_B_J11 TaxID=1400861 RepID=A0A7U7G8W3_9GAMM|nr:hypothetical protein BN874_130064 [Candidatus Contendobacter odensis Run_B_J11]
MIRPIKNSSTTAPTVAVTTEPIKPTAVNPSNLNKKPPTTAPMMPTTMLPSSPKPPPFIIVPASQPASAPIARKITKLVMSTLLPLVQYEKQTGAYLILEAVTENYAPTGNIRAENTHRAQAQFFHRLLVLP